MALRYDLDNCWPGCRECHSKPQHNHEYATQLTRKKGIAFVENLRKRGYQYTKAPNKAEMEEIINDLTYKLTAYGNKNGIGAKTILDGRGSV